jgi:glycosyltransferase involved in cell wall biosynthesis
MKIAFIHPSWPGDEGTGATHSATQVVHGLNSRGHDVHVICTDEIPTNATFNGPKLYDLPMKERPYCPTNLQLNHALRQRATAFDGFDVVHSYLPSVVPALSTIGQKTDAATVVTLNAYIGICAKNDLRYLDREQCTSASLTKCTQCVSRTSFGHPDYGPAYRTANRLGNLELVREGKNGLEQIDGFRAPSKHVKQNYAQFGYPSDRISVIPHPLNDDFRVDHRSDFTEPYRLLYVGYLKPKKGVDKLVSIVARLRDTMDRAFTLTIVGSGPREQAMRERAAELGVEDIVEVRGFIPNKELPETYADHDLFVYPSLWEEPLGRVYLEALATGTPIISSDYGDIKNVMGCGGVAVENSTEGFSAKIRTLLEDERLESMSKAAQQRAMAFERDKVIVGIEDMYTKALQRQTG